ncbi:phage tail tube protein [Roseovarius indicus]|uniref:phage tail tube protein n=1 Tax=Roseovarius indicus TaxID=540747 RepID=UPI0007D9D6EA|nr:phage tail tube protein [Roseovarius indicus]OAO02714.1 hypothetical protein A8B76_05065 [Roseovarius indicus]
MARHQGINTQFAGVLESSYGTAPGTGFFNLPFISHTLGATHPLEEDDTLSGRKERAPEKGATEAGGEVVVPLEAESIGFWLTALFGESSTTGVGPYTHVWEAGAVTSLPSLALETWMSAVPHSDMVTGCVAEAMSIEVSPTGKATARITLMAQDATEDTSSNAGTPSDFGEYNRFAATSAALQRNGSALSSKGENGTLTMSNDLDALRGLDGTGLITDIVPGRSIVTFNPTLRFASQAVLSQAIGHTSANMDVAYSTPGGESLTFLMHEIYLPRPKVPIEGPAGVQVTFDGRAVIDPSTDKQMTVTLVNNTESY